MCRNVVTKLSLKEMNSDITIISGPSTPKRSGKSECFAGRSRSHPGNISSIPTTMHLTYWRRVRENLSLWSAFVSDQTFPTTSLFRLISHSSTEASAISFCQLWRCYCKDATIPCFRQVFFFFFYSPTDDRWSGLRLVTSRRRKSWSWRCGRGP